MGALPGCRREGQGPERQEAWNRTEPVPRAKAGKPYRHRRSRVCEACHTSHHKEWSLSMHALAHKEPIYDFYFMTASRQSQKKLETFCARCHTPISVMEGKIPFKHPLRKPGDTRVRKAAAEGVQCDFCHTLTGYTQVFNSGYVARPSNEKHGPLADARPVSHTAKHNPLYRRSELCGTCHNVNHPTNGIVLEATYTEWKKSPYAKAGITCQDCHLTGGHRPPGLGPTPRLPGKAAIMGKKRPHVSRHYFVGPNLVFLQGPEAKKRRELSEQLLRRSAKVAIQELTRKGQQLQLKVRVTNTGAGHHLPTGVSELREVWLEVRVTDEKGQVRYHSGALDEQGNIRPGAVVYRTVVHDKNGKDTTLFWNTVKKVSDRRIPPLQSLVETYGVAFKGGAPKSVTVEVALHYRSVGPWGLAEAGVPKGSIKIPIFTISRAKKKLSL